MAKRRQTQFSCSGSRLRTKPACKTVWKADEKCVCLTGVPILPEQSLGSDEFPVCQLESFSYGGNDTSHFSAPRRAACAIPKERGHRFAEVGCGSPCDGQPALVGLYLDSSPMAGLVPYSRSGIVAASEQYGPGSMGGSNAAPLNPSKPGFPFWLLPFRSNAVLPPTPSCGVRPRNTPYLPHPIRDHVGSGPAGNRGRRACCNPGLAYRCATSTWTAAITPCCPQRNGSEAERR
jgi:hypothetical protein